MNLAKYLREMATLKMKHILFGWSFELTVFWGGIDAP